MSIRIWELPHCGSGAEESHQGLSVTISRCVTGLPPNECFFLKRFTARYFYFHETKCQIRLELYKTIITKSMVQQSAFHSSDNTQPSLTKKSTVLIIFSFFSFSCHFEKSFSTPSMIVTRNSGSGFLVNKTVTANHFVT